MTMEVTAGYKGLDLSCFISDIRLHTGGGQHPTVTLPM